MRRPPKDLVIVAWLLVIGPAIGCACPAAVAGTPPAAASTLPTAATTAGARSESPAAPDTAAVPALPPSALDALLNGERLTVPLADLPARVALAPGENFKVIEIGRDAASSHHVVALREREPLHRHDTHDLLVVTLEGHGSMLIGTEERAIGPRSIVYVPRGTVHAMRNTSGGVLYGYAMFSPPFDGKDRVPVTP